MAMGLFLGRLSECHDSMVSGAYISLCMRIDLPCISLPQIAEQLSVIFTVGNSIYGFIALTHIGKHKQGSQKKTRFRLSLMFRAKIPPVNNLPNLPTALCVCSLWRRKLAEVMGVRVETLGIGVSPLGSWAESGFVSSHYLLVLFSFFLFELHTQKVCIHGA